MTTLYAQPYNIEATGFYFHTIEDYDRKANGLKDRFGQPVEEFEIQFIDGERIDCELAKAVGLSQCNLQWFLNVSDAWEDHHKINFIIAVSECRYEFDIENDHPDDLDIEVYQESNLRDLAIQFVDEGLFGDVPKAFENYIDYDAIARDLAIDYCQTCIAGMQMIFRCS